MGNVLSAKSRNPGASVMRNSAVFQVEFDLSETMYEVISLLRQVKNETVVRNTIRELRTEI
jgi:hypothetical protein